MRLHKVFLVLSFSILFLQTIGQDAKTDSLKAILGTTPDDSTKVNTLLSIGKIYMSSSPDDAIKYIYQAIILADTIHFDKGKALSLKTLGNVYYNQGKYIEAVDNWKKSLSVFESIGDKKGVANIQSNLGAIFFNQGDDANALDYNLKSLKVSEEIADTLRIATSLINIGAIYANKNATLNKALDYYLRALPLAEATGDNDAIGYALVNLGEVYFKKNDDALAIKYFERSLIAYENSESIPYSLNYIGKVYLRKGDYELAKKYHEDAFDKAKKLDARLDMAQSLLCLGEMYQKKGDNNTALKTYLHALEIARDLNVSQELKDAYQGLALTYANKKDFANAFKYQNLLIGIKDTLYNNETDKKLTGLQLNYDIEKKQAQIDLLTKDKALQELDLQKQKFAKNSLTVGFILVFIIAFILLRIYRIKVKTNKLLGEQKVQIENLLLNILPSEVATELQQNGTAIPRYYESVSVLFTDFKDFSKIAELMTPNELVSELSTFFNAFDDIVEKHNLEKIKTIGDSYMCAGGIPTVDKVHQINIIKAGLEIQQYMIERNNLRKELNQPVWSLRVGIHTGPIVAGVVGKKKYAYDIWGSTVNIASRMESNGEPGKVNISSATFDLVKDQFSCIHRGKISAKNIGEIDMYFVNA